MNILLQYRKRERKNSHGKSRKLTQKVRVATLTLLLGQRQDDSEIWKGGSAPATKGYSSRTVVQSQLRHGELVGRIEENTQNPREGGG